MLNSFCELHLQYRDLLSSILFQRPLNNLVKINLVPRIQCDI